jgi:hypothetical protein
MSLSTLSPVRVPVQLRLTQLSLEHSTLLNSYLQLPYIPSFMHTPTCQNVPCHSFTPPAPRRHMIRISSYGMVPFKVRDFISHFPSTSLQNLTLIAIIIRAIITGRRGGRVLLPPSFPTPTYRSAHNLRSWRGRSSLRLPTVTVEVSLPVCLHRRSCFPSPRHPEQGQGCL